MSRLEIVGRKDNEFVRFRHITNILINDKLVTTEDVVNVVLPSRNGAEWSITHDEWQKLIIQRFGLNSLRNQAIANCDGVTTWRMKTATVTIAFVDASGLPLISPLRVGMKGKGREKWQRLLAVVSPNSEARNVVIKSGSKAVVAVRNIWRMVYRLTSRELRQVRRRAIQS